jgi:hypothetical protein
LGVLIAALAVLWNVGTVAAVFVWDSVRHIAASLLRERRGRHRASGRSHSSLIDLEADDDLCTRFGIELLRANP